MGRSPSRRRNNQDCIHILKMAFIHQQPLVTPVEAWKAHYWVVLICNANVFYNNQLNVNIFVIFLLFLLKFKPFIDWLFFFWSHKINFICHYLWTNLIGSLVSTLTYENQTRLWSTSHIPILCDLGVSTLTFTSSNCSVSRGEWKKKQNYVKDVPWVCFGHAIQSSCECQWPDIPPTPKK